MKQTGSDKVPEGARLTNATMTTELAHAFLKVTRIVPSPPGRLSKREALIRACTMPLLKKVAYTPDLAPPQLTPDHEVLVVRFTGELCTAYE